MRYNFLLKGLTILIYLKRFVWWFSKKNAVLIVRLFSPIIKTLGYLFYRTGFVVDKKLGLNTGLNRRIFKRDNLQVVILIFLFFLAIPQTKLYGKTGNILPGQYTIAYSLVNKDQNFRELEEVVADKSAYSKIVIPSWKEGTVSSEDFVATDYLQHDQELAAGIVAGGTAVSKPVVFPGTFVGGGGRTEAVEYIVQPGDTISGIAFSYGVSAATVLWENNLSSWSLIQPGDKLRILPVNGLTHEVKSGDTLLGLAKMYGGKAEAIASFNRLKEDGSNLRIGEKIIIPDGVRHYQETSVVVITQSYSQIGIPASSQSRPSASGFVWPCAMRMITQYYWWGHTAIDISGPNSQNYGSAIYASKAGTVETAQCGWNAGYGCYIVIDHGGGYKTLYGHSSRLLVNPGQYVNTGQTIALMGNTGRVYGSTGVHLHFEIQVNGWNVNPLGYVR